MKRTLEEFRKRCPGILGTLVLDGDGAIAEQELPSFLEMDTAQLTGQLSDMYLALEPLARRPGRVAHADGHDIVLTFDSIIVYCRVLRSGRLVLLAEQDANITKVRALSNLLIKKLDTLLQERKGAADA